MGGATLCYANPLLLKAFRLFTPKRSGTDSFLDTLGFEMAAQLMMRSANVKQGAQRRPLL